ncbi:hypothetical protein JST97_27170 [bacterium]|nr:hypothetical protein [bacterium]
MKRTLALGALSLLIGCGPGGPQSSPTPTAAPGSAASLQEELAVVEGPKLMEQHPDYAKLKDLELQMEKLETEKKEVANRGRQQAFKQGQGTFLRALEQAKAEMQAEQASISGEMDGLARALQGQMSAEMTEIKSKLDADLKGTIAKYRPPETAKLNDRGIQAVGEYGENLKLMAARNLTAHRLEKEKAIKAEIDAERNRLDQQIAAYEDEVSMKYQEEKLNLQLKMQNNPNEETEKVTRERLNVIDDEVSAAKAEKRKEIEGQMAAYHEKKQAEFEAEMKSYEARLRDEIAVKVGGRREQLINQSSTSVAPPPEIQAKISQAQATMQAAMESRRAELMAKMKAKESEARARMMAKQEEIKSRLARLEKDLQEQLSKRTDFLDKKSKARLAEIDKSMEKCRSDYKLIYERMRVDLEKMVGSVAKKKNIGCVISVMPTSANSVGEQNLKLQDLTDLSMVEVKQMGSH